MVNYLPRATFFIFLLQSQFAWPAITTSAWKMLFHNLAKNTSLSPREIVQIGLDLKTAEHASATLDEEGMKQLVLRMRFKQNSTIVPQLEDQQIGFLANLFTDLGRYYHINALNLMLNELLENKVFSQDQITYFLKLRDLEFGRRRDQLVGIAPDFAQKLENATDRLDTFDHLTYEDQLTALLKASSLRGEAATNAKNDLLKNPKAVSLKELYFFFLLLQAVNESVDDPKFSLFLHERATLWFAGTKSQPAWFKRLRIYLGGLSVDAIAASEEVQKNVISAFLTAQAECQRQEMREGIMIAVGTISSVFALGTSPLWVPYLFSANDDKE